MNIGRIIFATGNEGKLKEAEAVLETKLQGTSLDIFEVQSLDADTVVEQKALSYFEALKKPLFVEDTSLYLDELNGLPGTYIDAFMKALGNEGIINLLRGLSSRGAYAQTKVAFIDEKRKPKVFTGKINGSIAETPKGTGFGWDPIFIPEGNTQTFGEMALAEKNKYSMRAKALFSFKQWLTSKK